jgi:hypothetical protein
VFATGVPGANGLAFDPDGNLWISDSVTAQGRVWRVGPGGGAGVEVFRVQPMANDVNVAGGVGGVGRDIRSLPPGSIAITPTSRAAADTLGSQHLVANGLAFTDDGHTLYVADTARGAIWRVQLGRNGELRSPAGAGQLRNQGPLEFPTSPFLTGRKLCVTQSDGSRRDNFPNTGGEVGPNLPERAKISCLDQRLAVGRAAAAGPLASAASRGARAAPRDAFPGPCRRGARGVMLSAPWQPLRSPAPCRA